MMLLIAVYYMGYSIGIVFIICEGVQRGCDAFNDLENIVECQMDWYLYPKDMKKLLLVIVNVIQQPVEVKCFGSIPCNRETFVKVNYYSCHQLQIND